MRRQAHAICGLRPLHFIKQRGKSQIMCPMLNPVIIMVKSWALGNWALQFLIINY
jgi:hypothetical protein